MFEMCWLEDARFFLKACLCVRRQGQKQANELEGMPGGGVPSVSLFNLLGFD